MWRKGWCGEDGVAVPLCNACGACVRIYFRLFFFSRRRRRRRAFGALTREDGRRRFDLQARVVVRAV